MRPPVLYRGSGVLVERLRPHQAYDGLDTRGTAAGVFATSHRDLALVFALDAVPDAAGRITRLVRSLSPVCVIFLEGGPNRGGTGYLYALPSDGFAPLDEVQRISDAEVVPLAIEPIRVDEYLHLVEVVPEDERLRLLAAFDQSQRR